MLSRKTLRGMSYDKAALFGLPHIGARYTSSGYEPTQDFCCLCGKTATNCHHVVPRSIRKTFRLETLNGSFELKSPLFVLCGSGTTGCHNGFHGAAYLKAEWVWSYVYYEDAWWSGELLAEYGAHSRDLYRFGAWRITDKRTDQEITIRG